MRPFIRCIEHLLLGAILGMIFIAVSHSSPAQIRETATQLSDWAVRVFGEIRSPRVGEHVEHHVSVLLNRDLLDQEVIMSLRCVR